MTQATYHVIAPAFNHPAASDAESFGSAVWLWMNATPHSQRPLFALEHMLLPAIRLGQYVLVIEKSSGTGALRPVGYLGWANLSAEAEARYVNKPITGLQSDDWNSGDRMWCIDFMAPFGNASPIYNQWKSLFASASARYLYHRSHERGVQVRQFKGARVTSDQAHQWWATRPILAV